MRAEQIHEEGSAVGRLLAGLVTRVCQVPRLVLAGALLLTALSCYAFLTRLEYHTQRNDLLSADKDYLRRWQQYVSEFGRDDDLVVVVEGADRKRMEQALDALAGEVQRRPDCFDRLFYKVDLRHLQSRALLHLPADQIRQIQANLKSMGLLLDFGPLSWQSLNLLSLLHEARDRAGKISPGSPLSGADDQFLTQLLAISRSATASLDNPEAYRNPWHSLLDQAPEQRDLLAEPQYFFSPDGSLAFLLARPVQDESSFTSAHVPVAALRELIAAVAPRFPDLRVGLTGLPVLETDEMVASQRDTTLASWLALAGVTVLYLLVFRSCRYPLLTVTTLVIGTAWAMGWLTVTVGHLNILSATFAMMLIGLGDYGVLWVTRYEQERAGGAEVVTAMRATAGSVGPGILTAAITTCLAFYAAMLADFRAVAELGWIAGSGVLLCAVSCFTVMPALLKLADRRERALPVAIPIESGAAWLPWLSRRPRLVMAVSLGVAVVLVGSATRVAYDHNLLNLQARNLDSVEWERRLIERTAGASWHALSYTSSKEEALALKARFEQLPGVGRVVEVASLIPSGQEWKIDQLRDIQHRLRRLPERGSLIPHALPNVPLLKAELSCLIGQLQPLSDASPQPVLTNLRRSLMALHEQLADLPRDVTAQRVREFEERLTRDLAEDLHRLRDVSTPQAITTADLPAALRERYLGKTGTWLLRVFGTECLWEYGPLEEFVRQIQSVDPEATGKPFSTLEGLRAMREGFLWAGVYALAAIVLVLLADFRNVKHTLLALAPLGLGVAMTLGILGLCDIPLNPANMIAFPLVLGVGVDNGVHVLHDYLARRREAGRYTLSRTTGRGIFVAALTTILGFGSLMISQHRGLVGLGLLLTLGVSCCMVSALVFLPAVLRVLSGRRKKARREAERRAARAA